MFANDDLLLWDRNEIDIVDAQAVEQRFVQAVQI